MHTKREIETIKRAWTNARSEQDKEKIIKKHKLTSVMSNLRMGEIKMGVTLSLKPGRAIAGLDDKNELIFIKKLKGAPGKKSQFKIVSPENMDTKDLTEEVLNEDGYLLRVDNKQDRKYPKTRQGLNQAYNDARRESRWAILHIDSRGQEIDLVDMKEDKIPLFKKFFRYFV